MEDDQERRRPYSVVTREEVKENMKKQSDEISQIFLISRSEAIVLLMNLRWDSVFVSERLSEDKTKLLTESGLVLIDSIHDDDDDDDDDKISTPFCSHKFSKTYWSEFLEKHVFSLDAISCPESDCQAAVGPDTMEKLTIRDKEMYDDYVLRSYLEGNKKKKKKKIKKCPAKDCNYIIEFRHLKDVEEHSLNVVCLCGYNFCWRCSLESHRPVTCNNAFDWLSRDLNYSIEESNRSLTDSWIETNTKPCPHCLSPIQLDHYYFEEFLTCACSGRFCWKCLRSEESHEGIFGGCVEAEIPLGSRAQVEISCVDRWEAGHVAMEKAKSALKTFEESIIDNPRILSDEYIRIMKEGLMLVVQCRQVLKWSCVYEYLHTEYETSKKEYLRYIQDNAAALVQSYSDTLKEEAEKDRGDTFEELSCFKSKSSTATSNIGNYFYHFIKSLQDGLVEVKVRSYDNVAGPLWFCDRCTYGNSWIQMECKMCCDPKASLKEEELSDQSFE